MRIKTCTSGLTGLLLLLIPIEVWAQNAVLPPLNNPSSETGLPGKFIWADLFSADVDTAKRFYTGLFDWQWQAVDDNYSIAYSAEHPVAGLVFRAQQPGETARALWVHYASVRDVQAAATAVEQQGGRIMVSPKTVAQRGDYAIFSDQDGVLFGALHSLSGDPDDYQVPLGQWIWSQLVTADATRSADFYQSILGYDVYE